MNIEEITVKKQSHIYDIIPIMKLFCLFLGHSLKHYEY